MEIDDEDSAASSADESKVGRSPRLKESTSSDEDEVPQSGRGIGAGIGMTGGRGGAGIGAGATTSFGTSHTSFIHGGEGAAATDTPSPRPSASTPPILPRHSSFMHGGIGSTGRHQADAQAEQSMHPPDHNHAFPPSFAQPPKERRRGNAFQGRQAAKSSTSVKSADVAPEDMRHLQSISSSFGARLLAKQGWVAGKGLGLQEDGKAVPIEANRNIIGRQGIGKGVRTEQSKREARERGEKFSSDEEGEKRKSRKTKVKQHRQDGAQQSGLGEEANWKKNKKVKIKVEHKTYDQLLAEAGQAGSYGGVGPILDARSGEVCRR
jgi:tuftelin-interacting protein 11